MPLLRNDQRFLHDALALARSAAAFASPNPAVGCLLTRETVLGAGAHLYDLRDHAEIAALKQAASQGHDVRGGTAYVTLEPCSHHGRTGPCADALVAAGISRCVVATVDPNLQVRGGGIAKLRDAGVDVVLADPSSEIAEAARRLNDAFAFSIQYGRPFVTLKSAVSPDGKLAPPPSARLLAKPHWITGEAARADVQELRHRADALLTGIGTVLADDPSLTDRTGLLRRRRLLRVVLDSKLLIPLDSQLVRSVEGDLLVIADAEADPSREAALRARGVEVERLPAPGASGERLRQVLTLLGERQIRSLLVEAGQTLNGALLAAGLVDQMILYTGPEPLGPEALPFAAGQPDPTTWIGRLTKRTTAAFPHDRQQDLRVSGYLHDPWDGV